MCNGTGTTTIIIALHPISHSHGTHSSNVILRRPSIHGFFWHVQFHPTVTFPKKNRIEFSGFFGAIKIDTFKMVGRVAVRETAFSD